MECNLYTLYIKKYREMRRMSQSELAFKIGKSQGFISQIEADNSTRKKSILLSDIIKIADILDVCPNVIIRFKCSNCLRFDKCTRHEHLEDDTTYINEYLEFYI